MHKGTGAPLLAVWGLTIPVKRTLCKQMCQCSRAALVLSLFAQGGGKKGKSFRALMMAGVGFVCQKSVPWCSYTRVHYCTGRVYRRAEETSPKCQETCGARGHSRASYLKALFCVLEFIQTLVSYKMPTPHINRH